MSFEFTTVARRTTGGASFPLQNPPHTSTVDAMNCGSQSRIIGMMSGTSVDSVDAALCEITESRDGRLTARLLAFHEHPVPASLRGRIFHLFKDGPGALALACSLNFEIGAAFAEAALALLEEAGSDRAGITAIASHGQTAYHIPPHMADAHLAPSTLQIGEGAVIAERTGIPVVCNFRTADMAAGGNGAPVVPFADFHLFSRPGEAVIVHNIGGISNCTVLPASGSIGDIIAFDTGPGNMVIDALVQRFFPGEDFDRDGARARRGTVSEPLLAQWMAIPYIALPPPKSTGRELFGAQFAAHAADEHPGIAPNDLIATATAFTARSIARNLAEHVLPHGPVKEVLVGGGGARNGFLMEQIADCLCAEVGRTPQTARSTSPTQSVQSAQPAQSHTPVVRLLDDTGFPAKARECVAFAILGHARLRGIPANIPAATGARHPALLGVVVEPPPAASR
jgi:anhydro-N-acetylmuramic acid kinase